MNRALGILLLISIPIIGYLYLEEDGELRIPGVTKQQPIVLFDETVPLRVGVAKTAFDRATGLSGRERLGPTEGLLFVFDESDYHGIWMKDMNFPIDVVWIDEEFRIVHIERNMRPDTFPTVFEPNRPARFVIETNANFTDSFGIEVGDPITLPDEAIPEDLQE